MLGPLDNKFFVNEKQEIQMFEPEKYSERSQDLQKAYHDAGQFYLATTKAVLDETQAFSNYSSPLIIPRYRAVDIDTKEDFELAEKLFILNKRTDFLQSVFEILTIEKSRSCLLYTSPRPRDRG